MRTNHSKYPEFFFESSGGEGPLYICFEAGTYGNAIDDETGKGAGFFNDQGELIAVLFDRVLEKADRQALKFKKGESVKIKIANGTIIELKSTHSKSPKFKEVNLVSNK